MHKESVTREKQQQSGHNLPWQDS